MAIVDNGVYVTQVSGICELEKGDTAYDKDPDSEIPTVQLPEGPTRQISISISESCRYHSRRDDVLEDGAIVALLA